MAWAVVAAGHGAPRAAVRRAPQPRAAPAVPGGAAFEGAPRGSSPTDPMGIAVEPG